MSGCLLTLAGQPEPEAAVIHLIRLPLWASSCDKSALDRLISCLSQLASVFVVVVAAAASAVVVIVGDGGGCDACSESEAKRRKRAQRRKTHDRLDGTHEFGQAADAAI